MDTRTGGRTPPTLQGGPPPHRLFEISDDHVFYKASKLRFDGDAAFKERAQQAVVTLQRGEEKYRKPWAQICEISRPGFEKVYQRLGVHLEEKGESFYNPYIPRTLDLLRQKGLLIEETKIETDKGAQVIKIEGKKRPLIVVKTDGAFNYASTDLAAMWLIFLNKDYLKLDVDRFNFVFTIKSVFHVVCRYRLNEEKAEWIIYVTDVGQREHFEMFFTAAKLAGWLPTDENQYPKISHVGFGLVLGDDGKRFRTRSTEVVKLVDLLDEAKTRCKAALVERGKAAEWTSEELDQTAEAIGYGAVKYADLKNNRLTNYTFSFDQMLNDKGNTAVYLLYAHARICSIIRKSGKDIEALKKDGQIKLEKDEERKLGLHLLQFPEVVGSAEETSRLLLCEATAVVMRKCFHLLGITPVYKI
ncbi:hypothetical protein M8C21_005567 [Ambrosia artemisiifolia]|uniref:arginine--tRNA ligase n=1 Tax=Ambrosia artemisiifolia TaxID=4212 RepID=A0AAD5BZQ2_AMBAR|nr:hypothetical protein M8C21_005567 [Ambrosia artemisiifolia]